MISVEAALNSRCSSESEGGPGRGHHGRYDPRPLTAEERKAVVGATLTPRFGRGELVVTWTDYLRFGIEGAALEREGDTLHIDSGMQHQAAHLACAALGLGACIFNLGQDGTAEGGNLGTARMLVQGMRPAYAGSRWTEQPPAGGHPWQPGTLPDPVRRGERGFFEVLQGLSTADEGRPGTIDDLSQVVWAARGRTPHIVRGQEWGLTIPTWAGEQDHTRVWVLDGERSCEYVNWEDERPTHSLRRCGPPPHAEVMRRCGRRENGWLVVFGVNEERKRARWEVGYMLLSAMLAAAARGIGYQAMVLGEQEQRALAAVRLAGAMAAVAV